MNKDKIILTTVFYVNGFIRSLFYNRNIAIKSWSYKQLIFRKTFYIQYNISMLVYNIYSCGTRFACALNSSVEMSFLFYQDLQERTAVDLG